MPRFALVSRGWFIPAVGAALLTLGAFYLFVMPGPRSDDLLMIALFPGALLAAFCKGFGGDPPSWILMTAVFIVMVVPSWFMWFGVFVGAMKCFKGVRNNWTR